MTKTIALTALSVAALALAPPATAAPSMCGNHMENSSASFGYAGQGGATYIAACAGDAGGWQNNNATVPGVSTGIVGGVEQFSPPAPADLGSNDESQHLTDEDGIQGHDNVTNSPAAHPGRW